MASIAVVLRDPGTGIGLPDQTLKLRHLADGFATDVYTLSQIDSVTKPGAYKVNGVTTGTYKLWVNGTEDPTFGADEGVEITEHDDIIIKVVDGDDTYWDGKGHEFRNAGAPTAGTSLIRQDDADARYLRSGEDLDLQTVGILIQDGVNAQSPASVQQLVDLATDLAVSISEIVVTPYQESPNKVRLIPGGSTKTGQVYTSWNDAAIYCKSSGASSTKRFVVEVCGMGVSGSTSVAIASNDGGTPTGYFNNYISYFIANRFIKLLVPNDTMEVSTLGMTSVEGGTLFIDDVAANPRFNNLHFVNVYFDLVCASVIFTNCKFENCFIKVNDDSDDTATFTTCKGSGTTSNQVIPSTITGWGEKSKDDF
jgi:hypothetical protein